VVLLAALPSRDEPARPDDLADLADAATLFKALADPIRVKLLALVRQAPTGEACFCDLASLIRHHSMQRLIIPA